MHAGSPRPSFSGRQVHSSIRSAMPAISIIAPLVRAQLLFSRGARTLADPGIPKLNYRCVGRN
jgi:hypothetical protein